jgi:hypothetical protein
MKRSADTLPPAGELKMGNYGNRTRGLQKAGRGRTCLRNTYLHPAPGLSPGYRGGLLCGRGCSPATRAAHRWQRLSPDGGRQSLTRRRLSLLAGRGTFPRLSGYFHRKPPPPVPFPLGLPAKTPLFTAVISHQCEKTPLLPPAALPSGQTFPSATFGQRD